jgi:hypothetical protein
MKGQNISVHGFGVGGWRTEVRPSAEEKQPRKNLQNKKIMKRGRDCFRLHKFYTAPGLTQQQWRLFPREKSDWSVKLTTHLHMEPRLRMCGTIPSRLID